MTRLAALAAKLAAAGQTVAVAETSAGGLIAAELLGQAGASKWFRGGVVAYTKDSKFELLGLMADESKPTSTEPHAAELAAAVKAKLQSTWAIGETGVAGPGANSRGVAPGVCALAVVGPGGAKALSRTLWPDDELSTHRDVYGQAPKIPRRASMAAFRDAAIDLLCDAVDRASQDEPSQEK